MKYMKMGLLLLAGSFFLSGCGGKVKAGVEINGVQVGGMGQKEAAERIRATFERLPLAECSISSVIWSTCSIRTASGSTFGSAV